MDLPHVSPHYCLLVNVMLTLHSGKVVLGHWTLYIRRRFINHLLFQTSNRLRIRDLSCCHQLCYGRGYGSHYTKKGMGWEMVQSASCRHPSIHWVVLRIDSV